MNCKDFNGVPISYPEAVVRLNETDDSEALSHLKRGAARPARKGRRARTAASMRCNRCHRPMRGATAYDGACECGGLIEVAP